MNLKHRYLIFSVRMLLGLIFVFSAVAGFMTSQSMLAGNVPEGTPPEMVEIIRVLWDAGILQAIKATELVIGVMLLFNLLPTLAAIFVAPLAIGFVLFSTMHFSGFGLGLSIVIGLLDAYLGYFYWEKYKRLFQK